MTANQSIYKNEAAKKAYFAAYDHSLETWPVAYESRYVSTTFGDTHILVSGPTNGKPIVLLHGKNGSATMWRDNMAAISCERRVYALDILGDLGKSNVIKKYSNRREFADWLTQVLDGLDLQKTDMVGISMGSYLIVNYALEKPERLNKIVLLAPAATFSSFTRNFLIIGLMASVFGNEFLFKRMLRSYVGSDELLENAINTQAILGMKFATIPNPFLLAEKLPDAELKSLKVPALLAVGENETINQDSPEIVIEKAKKLVPNIQTIIVPGGYHSLNMTNPEQVNDLILKFLSD